MARDLAVFLAGQRVGTTSQGSGVEFVHDEAYLATRGATPLSLSMPLTSRRHANRVTRSWVGAASPRRPGGGIMHQRTVAMSLGGERQFGMVRQGHLRRLVEVNSLDVDAWLERSRQLAQMMPDAASDERAASAGIRGADGLLGRMVPGVVQLCTRVLKA